MFDTAVGDPMGGSAADQGAFSKIHVGAFIAQEYYVPGTNQWQEKWRGATAIGTRVFMAPSLSTGFLEVLPAEKVLCGLEMRAFGCV